MTMLQLNKEERDIILKHRVLRALNAAEDCINYIQSYKDPALPHGISGSGCRGSALDDIKRARELILLT